MGLFGLSTSEAILLTRQLNAEQERRKNETLRAINQQQAALEQQPSPSLTARLNSKPSVRLGRKPDNWSRSSQCSLSARVTRLSATLFPSVRATSASLSGWMPRMTLTITTIPRHLAITRRRYTVRTRQSFFGAPSRSTWSIPSNRYKRRYSRTSSVCAKSKPRYSPMQQERRTDP